MYIFSDKSAGFSHSFAAVVLEFNSRYRLVSSNYLWAGNQKIHVIFQEKQLANSILTYLPLTEQGAPSCPINVPIVGHSEVSH